MTASIAPPTPRRRVPEWFITTVLAVLVLFLLVLAAEQVASTQTARGVQGGFAFLWQASGFQISESLLNVSPTDPYWQAIAAGLVNTLTVALVAIPLATLLGIVLGGLRLSGNPLVARCTTALIEPIRNTPVLLQLFVWYGLLLQLPTVRDAWMPLPGVMLSNRGLALPAISGCLPHVLATLVVAFVWHRSRNTRHRGWRLLAVASLVGIWLLLPAPHIQWPVKQGLGLRGGWQPSIELTALLVGLIVFHAAYIADIVRGAVRAVPVGLFEAGQAMALSPFAIARHILYPYASRVALPAYANQCLALIKNSTLAIAIGYQDLMAIINTAITQTGLAVEGVSIAVVLYLGIAALFGWALALWNANATRHGADSAGTTRLGSRMNSAAFDRAALFGTRSRTLGTLATAAVLVIGGAALFQWAVFDAVWRGGAQTCADASGACWAAVEQNAPLLIFGTMSAEDRPRALFACAALILAVLFALSPRLPGRWRAWLFGLGCVAAASALGGWPWGAAGIAPLRWGGLVVTIVLALSAIALSLPLAVALALMRRSTFSWLRLPSTLLIEAVRGVPLVTQLLFASFVLPMLLGGQIGNSKFTMALAALSLHTACLLAEVLRGALQAVPEGQRMAAAALGLNRRTAFWTVVLPQARKIATPAALGVFVGAVKDTSLVTIIGVFDVLSAAKAAVASTIWRPYYVEIYLSVAVLYFVVCLGLSRVARRVEVQGG